ncbi:MAG: enoyl-CoA hydratase/isomerase family protein [Ignavibacteria bacterium]|nr:enoyl-CoA hydratase/isomerase family protein [Ignavibacteria bacterium]
MSITNTIPSRLFDTIRVENENTIATITLARADKRNALNDVMVRELTEAFSFFNRNGLCRVIILRGEGTAFCAGADLEYLQKLSNYSLIQNQDDSRNLMQLFRSMYESRKPIIAMVNGPALAGGCGLATVCDFIFAGKEKAQFGYTESRIGFVPAIVLLFLIRRIGEGRARELVMSGKILSSIDAKDFHLITEVVDDIKLEKFTYSFAEQLIEQNSSSSLALCKEMFVNISDMETTKALEYAAMMNALARMTDDCKKGIDGFLKKEKVVW